MAKYQPSHDFLRNTTVTKRYRDMGSVGTPSKNVASVGTKARIK